MSNLDVGDFVEMEWECDTCKGWSLGRYEKCVNCGSSKPAQCRVRDLAGAPQAVTEAEILEEAAGGADWICEYCQNRERGTDGQCARGCGGGTNQSSVRGKDIQVAREDDADLDVFQRAAQMEDLSLPVDGVFERAAAGDPDADRMSGRLSGNTPTPRQFVEADGDHSSSAMPRALMGLVGLVAFMGVMWLLWFLLVPHEEVYRVASTEWECSIVRDNLDTSSGRDFRSDMNRGDSGSYDIHSCSEAQNGTVPCVHNTCKETYIDPRCTPYSCPPCTDRFVLQDNGYKQKVGEDCATCYKPCNKERTVKCHDSDPNYEEICNYKWDEWIAENVRRTDGADHSPYYADVVAVGQRQRIRKSCKYTVGFANGEGEFDERLSRLDAKSGVGHDVGAYRTFQKGDIWIVKTRRIGSKTPVRPE